MVKITDLQRFIQDGKNWKSRVMSMFGLPGSGMDTVFKEISKFDLGEIYVYISPEDIGEINEVNAIKNLLFELSYVLDQKKVAKIKEVYDQDGDFYYYSKKLKELIRNINSERNIYIILDGFHEYMSLNTYFFLSIKNLISISIEENKNINFLFASESIYTKEFIYSKISKLSIYFLKHIEFVRGFEAVEIAEVLKNAVKDNISTAKKIYDLAAGNTNITDRILDLIGIELKNKNSFLLTDEFVAKLKNDIEIEYVVNRISQSINLNSKDLKLILNSRSTNIDPLYLDYYLGTGILITDRDQNFTIHSKLIEESLSSKNQVDISKKSVEQLGSINVNTDELSTQEFEVYNLFKSKKGQLVTKDEIGKIMWGEVKSGRKKDWAIDQLMKRLRNKIGDPNGQLLQTVRGRGYRLEA